MIDLNQIAYARIQDVRRLACWLRIKKARKLGRVELFYSVLRLVR
jgi:hypothetical protein